MNKLMRVLALLLAISLLAGCSLVEIDNSRIIVAKVDDQTITKAQFDESFRSYLALYGYTPESADIQEQLPELKTSYLEAMIDNLVIDLKARDMGFEATQEQKDAAYQEAQEWYDEQFASLVEVYKGDETIADPEQHARDIIEQHMTTYGYENLDAMAEESITAIPRDMLYDDTVKDVAVTDQEVQSEFDAEVAADEAAYAEDLATFVQDSNGGMTIYWKPEGLFYVKHILISLTEEQQEEVSSLRQAGNDADADIYRDAALASIKPAADEVLLKASNGEDFNALIVEYGEDPGMMEGTSAFEIGYLAFDGCDAIYVPEFAKACSELKAEGDLSGLVATDYGYHIILRCSDVPAGPVPFDEVSGLLNAKILSSKQSEAYDAALQEWKNEYKIELFENKL